MKKTIQRAIMASALSLSLFSAAAAETELTMYYPVAVGGPLTKTVDKMVDDFMAENPDIKVNAIYAGNYNDARVKALAALESGEPAQLSVMFSIDLYELIELDAIIPFDDLLESEEDKAWLNSFYPALMENATAFGKTWGIPFQRSTIVMYYNKDMFAEAGLDPETPPATWDELIAYGKKLTKDDGSQWGLMIPSTGYPYWMFGAFAMQNNEALMSKEGNETFFDKPAIVEALALWKKLGNDDKIMPKGMIEWGTLRQNFIEERTAMMWHSTGNLTAVRNEAKFNFGVAMLPAGKRRGSPTGGGNFYIFKKASLEEQKAALKFIQFMTAPERSAEWSVATGYMGVSPDAYKTDILQAYVKDFPAAAVARDQLEYATAELSTFQAGRIRKALDDALQAALIGSKTPQAALKEAQSVSKRVLRPYQ